MTPARLLLPALSALTLAACEGSEAPSAEPVEVPAPEAAAPQMSAPAPDPSACVTYDEAYAAAPLMRVRGAADSQVRFQDRAEACPATGDCGWRREGYLIGGDEVLASAEVNGFRCVYAASAGGDLAAGFLPAAELEPAPETEPLTAEFLAGRWRHLGENEIVFARAGGSLTARGTATYPTAGGSVNTGEVSGPITIADGTVRYADQGCEVSAARRGPFLVVKDNLGCGGLNVSFGGVYTRAD